MQKIYIAMHKPYSVPEDPLYMPLQVGAANHLAFCQTRDDTGENISEKNARFCELTGLYWIWRNTEAEVTGLVHYRRYFAAKRGSGSAPWNRLLTADELEQAMRSADIILPKKRHYIVETNLSQYAHAHHKRDLLTARAVIAERSPQDLPAFDAVMQKRSGHRFNMFIMKRRALNDYCEWLFPLLFELEKRIDTAAYDAYNRRVFGFLSERLLDVWLLGRAYPYREMRVLELERPSWFVKGGRFLLRKLKGSLRQTE